MIVLCPQVNPRDSSSPNWIIWQSDSRPECSPRSTAHFRISHMVGSNRGNDTMRIYRRGVRSGRPRCRISFRFRGCEFSE
jgi:hypothetical protein